MPQYKVKKKRTETNYNNNCYNNNENNKDKNNNPNVHKLISTMFSFSFPVFLLFISRGVFFETQFSDNSFNEYTTTNDIINKNHVILLCEWKQLQVNNQILFATRYQNTASLKGQ